MRQTDSAMRMLISAYKAVLANCYIKETLSGGVKRFCKGVALSSFLTAVLAGISINSYAETVSIKDFVDAAENQENKITIADKNTIIEGSSNGLGGDDTTNNLSGIEITVNKGTTLTINNIVNRDLNIKGDGDVVLNIEKST